MGLIKITADMTDAERTAVLNSNLQYLQLSNRLRKYPIGMIVAFDSDIDPNELFGGTWERIKGRFIWGIDDGETAGATGGEKEHTLTVTEMPTHSHEPDGWVQVMSPGANTGSYGAVGTKTGSYRDYKDKQGYSTSSVGGSQPHNNMPPYYGAYVWRKTGHGTGEDPTLTEYELIIQEMNEAISAARAEDKKLYNNLYANALRGTASGSAMRLTDVSPNEHTLNVKIHSKNLWQHTGEPAYINRASYESDTHLYTVNKSGVTWYAHTFQDPIPKNTAVSVTVEVISGNGAVSIGGQHKESGKKTWQGYVDLPKNTDLSGKTYTASFITDDTVTDLCIFADINSTIAEPVIFRVQYELGETATSYTDYIDDLSKVKVKVKNSSAQWQYFLPTDEGVISGITSLSPNMSFAADEPGVIINVEYNRDINKAFAELYSRL